MKGALQRRETASRLAALGLGLLTGGLAGCSESFWSRYSVEDSMSCYAGRACPSGYECSPATFLCYPEGTLPIPDGGSSDLASDSTPIYVLQKPAVLQTYYWNLRAGRFTDRATGPQLALSGDQSAVDFLAFGSGGTLDDTQTPERRTTRNLPTSLEVLSGGGKGADELVVATVDSILQGCKPGACPGPSMPDLLTTPSGGEVGLKFLSVGSIDGDASNDLAVVSSKLDLSAFGINAALGTGKGELLLQTAASSFNRGALDGRNLVMAAVGLFSREASDPYTVAATVSGSNNLQLFSSGFGALGRTTTVSVAQPYDLIAAADLPANSA